MSSDDREILRGIADLVATPSVSSTDPALDMSNAAVIDRLGDMLAAAGFTVERLALDKQPGKFNLIARKGSGRGGLVLSGHSDTVPSDESLWDSDPFKLTERDAQLYGLGATDMKAFFPLAIAAAARYRGEEFRRQLIVLATADEESGMSGARSLVDRSIGLADVALIGEPTGLAPVRLHKGILMERVSLSGKSGHSSDPALGINALDGMRVVLNALSDLRDDMRREHLDESFHVPYPTMNFGRIAGGDNPNRICGSCSLDIDCRFLPGMGLADVRNRIRACIRDALAGSGLGIDFHEIFHGIDAMNTPADASFVQAVEALTGQEAGAVAFATEAPLLAELGAEVVVAGPGSIDQAHQPNEYIPLDALRPAIAMIEGVIGKYCIDPAA
ncbi:MAG: acetylornithine deacetylase [Gammaproteobacteria bacterium]|nr:acetylornithine deacetylase [Gammaproteobacteria bacterium]